MHSPKYKSLQRVNIDLLKSACNARTKAKAAAIIRDAGFPPVPLKRKEKTAFLLNWPALAYAGLDDDEIGWLFPENVEIGIVLGNGIFAVDNDFDDDRDSRHAEQLQFEILGAPLARRRGNPARYADIYLDRGRRKSSRKLLEAAEHAVNTGLDYQEALEDGAGKKELGQLKEIAHKAYAEFKTSHARHCPDEVISKKRDVEIRGFGSQIAVPPSYHAKSQAAYFWDESVQAGDGLASEADTLTFMQELYPAYRAPVRGERGDEMPSGYTASYAPWRLSDIDFDFVEDRGDGSRDLMSLLGKIIHAVINLEGEPIHDLNSPDLWLNIYDLALDYIDEGHTPGIDRHLTGNPRGFEGKLAFDVLSAVNFAVEEHAMPSPRKRKPRSEPRRDLTISHELDYEENLDRAVERFVLYADKRDNFFLDMTDIGEPGWQTSISAFKKHYSRIYREWEDDKGKVHRVYLADDMVGHAHIKSARQLRYDPRWGPGVSDAVPDGAVNLYVEPEHPDSGGEVGTFLKFLKHLIPDPVDCKRVLKRLAYKLQKPWTRGAAILMVADNTFGCGRGLLFQILERLHGYNNVSVKEFQDVISSNWNEWLCENIYIAVPEVKAFKDAWRFSSKAEVYEKLKDIVDPGNARHDIRKRHTDSYSAEIFPTFILATNHIDALPLAADDRRFDVVANGEPISVRARDEILAWMDEPENIGALWHYLDDMDVSGTDPYGVPPNTFMKTCMIDAKMSDIDRALDDFTQFAREHEIEMISMRLLYDYIEGHAKINDNGIMPEDRAKTEKIIRQRRMPLLRDKERVRLANGERVTVCIYTYPGKATVREEVAYWSEQSEKIKRAEIERVAALIADYRKC